MSILIDKYGNYPMVFGLGLPLERCIRKSVLKEEKYALGSQNDNYFEQNLNATKSSILE